MSSLGSGGSSRARDVLFAAAKVARRASFTGRRPSEERTPAPPAPTMVADEEALATLPTNNSTVSIMPTVEEKRGHPISRERSNQAPFGGGSEQKSDDGGDGDGKRLSSTSKVFSKVSRAQQRPGVAPTSAEDEFTLDSSAPGDVRPDGWAENLSDGRVGHRSHAQSFVSSDGGGGNAVSQMLKRAKYSLGLSTSNDPHNGEHAHDLQSSDHAREHHGPVTLVARGKVTGADEAMLSDSEADYDAFDSPWERANSRLLSPNIRFFKYYATYMLFALLIFTFYMPIRVAFFPRESGAWSAVDLGWNAVFMLDMIIHLNTGFVDTESGRVVYDRRAILCRYAKGWLIVDFLAAFPLTFLPTLGPDDLDGNHEVAYLLSFPKIFQLFGLLILAQENFRLHEGGFLAVRTLISVIVTTHVFGCGWFMLATLMHTECEDLFFNGLPEGEFLVENGIEYTAEDYIGSECPWIYRNDYLVLPLSRKYLGSVYWALTTLTTVGYGDLSARTVDEQVYSMAVQIVGVSWYGYIVGSWASVLNSFDSEEEQQRSKMREVVAFSKAAALPLELAKRVRQHFRFALSRKDNWISFNEQEIVSDMPVDLRAEVVTFVQRKTIDQIPWFEGKDHAFIAEVVILLKPRLFKPGDTLYREGTQPQELLFITSGRLMLKYKDEHVGHLKHRQIAGLIGVVSNEHHKLTATVIHREAHCLALSRMHFLELMETYPDETQELLEAAKGLARRVAHASSDAREDFMTNAILAELIKKGQPQSMARSSSASPRGTRGRQNASSSPVSERWTQLSIGHDPSADTIGRGALPSGWGKHLHMPPQHCAPIAGTPHPAEPLSGAADMSASRTTASTMMDSGDGSNESSHHETGGAGDPAVPAGEPPAGIADIVSREVSMRMAGVEARLDAVLSRLEGMAD